MKLYDLFEGRDASLYHTMNYDKAMDVFENDMMPARWEHKIPGGDIVKGNSFTRNKNLRHADTVWLIINQNAITNNKIIPLDGEYVWAHSFDRKLPYNRQDRLRHQDPWGDREVWNSITKKNEIQRGQPLSEEFVVGDIKNLHRIITKIVLFDSGQTYLGPNKSFNLFELTEAYAKKHQIQFEVSQKYQSMIDQYLEWQEYDDD
jgi:hypothetical protein